MDTKQRSSRTEDTSDTAVKPLQAGKVSANGSCSKHKEIAGAKDQLDAQDHSITVSMPLIRGTLLAAPSLETGSGIDADLSISLP